MRSIKRIIRDGNNEVLVRIRHINQYLQVFCHKEYWVMRNLDSKIEYRQSVRKHKLIIECLSEDEDFWLLVLNGNLKSHLELSVIRNGRSLVYFKSEIRMKILKVLVVVPRRADLNLSLFKWNPLALVSHRQRKILKVRIVLQ